jgi:hypothetical protein
MKHYLVLVAVLLVALLVALPAMSLAQETKKDAEIKSSVQETKKAAEMKVKGTAGRFLVEAKHTPEECLKTLDEVSAKGSKTLARFEWGCMAGDHTGYAIVEAVDEAAVKAMLPAGMQNAHIVRLEKFTAEQIKGFHEKK